jgi:hypothetical protein
VYVADLLIEGLLLNSLLSDRVAIVKVRLFVAERVFFPHTAHQVV